MHYQNLTELDFASTCSKVFTTDVFDTLLLRTSKAERSRIAEGERRFSEQLARGGRTVSADLLLDTRLRAQRLAFRALNLGGRGEVRLIDVVSRQLRVLGLPESLVADRLRIELEVERESLVANEALAKYLRARRAEGSRVVAVSDTTLSGTQVLELIEHFHGDGLVDRAYSSADYGSTKRNGELFVAVANAENVALDDLIHIGDDVLADVRVPSAMGVHTHHVPRGAPRKYLRLADGATTEAQRRLRAIGTTFPRNRSPTPDRAAFAAEVFGPILVEFCVLLWLYTAQAEQTHSPVLLFCARGGIGIRAAFELVISKLELPLRTARKNLLVSRLVAARSALLARGESAVEELDREFRNGSFASVAAALGGRSYNLELEWQKAFSARDFLTLLNLPSGAEVLADIREQTLLFEHHLRSLSQGADRLILCDTGLYGSTQRLLADGFPQDHFETLQFARSNYKGHSEGHFQNVAGLLVEDNFYNPLNDRTCVLRYWQLIESLFEPGVSSVRSFQRDDNDLVTANCGQVEFGDLEPSVYNERLLAALEFIERLPSDGGASALAASGHAWRQLRHAITRPGDAELRALTVGTRSVDFGRAGSMEVLSGEQVGSLLTRLGSLKSQHWREGAIARDFPRMKHALLPALSTLHLVRRLVGKRLF